MVGYRFCSLLSLPCDTIRRFIHEKFRGFAANLDDVMTTRGLFEEAGAKNFSSSRYISVLRPNDEES